MNALKKIFFRSYISYYNAVPVEKGKYFLGKLLYNCFGYAVYSFEGIRMLLNPLSLIDRKIIEGEEHDPDVKRLINEELKNGGVYIDIGANIGYFSLLAAVKPETEVMAFEPSVRERNRLYDNIKLNAFNNITVFPYALSDRQQTLKLGIARDWNPGLNSFIVNLGTEQVDALEVKCYDFDSLFTEAVVARIRLIKIDVEGYEMTVLKGMKNSMTKLGNVKFVLEINSKFLVKANSSVDEIYNFFSSYGFSAEKGKSERAYDEIFYKMK